MPTRCKIGCTGRYFVVRTILMDCAYRLTDRWNIDTAQPVAVDDRPYLIRELHKMDVGVFGDDGMTFHADGQVFKLAKPYDWSTSYV